MSGSAGQTYNSVTSSSTMSARNYQLDSDLTCCRRADLESLLTDVVVEAEKSAAELCITSKSETGSVSEGVMQRSPYPCRPS